MRNNRFSSFVAVILIFKSATFFSCFRNKNKFAKRCKIDTPNTQIYDRSLCIGLVYKGQYPLQLIIYCHVDNKKMNNIVKQ